MLPGNPTWFVRTDVAIAAIFLGGGVSVGRLEANDQGPT
jgi:hypothetical protein